MKISTRLGLAGLFAIGALSVIAGVLLFATQQMKSELAKNEASGEILNAVSSLRYLTLEYVASHEERAQAQWRLRDASLSKLLSTATGFQDKDEQATLDDLRHKRQDIEALFSELVASRADADAGNSNKAVLQELESRLTGQIMNQAQDMISDALALSDSNRRGVLMAQQWVKIAVLVFGTAVILALVATWILMWRSVVRPLATLRAGIAVIAAGNLDYRLAITTHDEIGDLARAFDEMTGTLKGSTVSRNELEQTNAVLQTEMTDRKLAEEQLRELLQETRETAKVLGLSVSEILAGTTQIASGAVETAAAFNEATATVEEVKQTAHVSSQKAKDVSDAAQQAALVSRAGSKSVEDAIEGMQRIHYQMALIGESTVRLSEQTHAIGEIIATVNDLAEQSNLLAVNAAIEAARAGEQGRSFAVVAQEVRNLAEQSKQATVQVRSILGDIQQATSSVVLATEQGGKAVDAGVKESTEASEAIRGLSEKIAESAQAATQIAVSARQQLIGMDQMAVAMESIRVTATQNASSAKQAEMGAQNLHTLGQKLQDMLARFQV